MSFFSQVRRLLGRSEVDEINRTTGMLLGHRAETRSRAEQLAELRQSTADDRHPDLDAAMERRRNAVH